MTISILLPLHFSPSLPWFSLGLLMILIPYLEILRGHRRNLHILANSLLAPGFALIVLTITQHTDSLVFGLFALLLCFLWMETRIQLSHWRHVQLCAACSEPCKNYQ